MTSTVPRAEAEARLLRVGAHIEELRESGRNDDAEAIQYVRDLAQRALTTEGPGQRGGLLTTGQAGLALGLSDQTVRNWVATGRLRAVRRGVRTMVPREAIESEIERSYIRPSAPPVPEDEASPRIAWRRQLLAPPREEIAARLEALHDKLEDGQELSAEERAEMVHLERQMANAAAGVLEGFIGRRPAGAT